ncbi:MAG TPA: DUF5808 domain-containing protein [Actinopolymorphaceae bacterium]|jgi:hypothetical protein
MARRKKRRFGRLDALLVGGVGALVAASVIKELRQPPSERSWRGRVAGVPYDYRPPTLDRLRSTWWAPEDERLLQPTAYGLGWDVNVGRVVKLASDVMAQRSASNGHPLRRFADHSSRG